MKKNIDINELKKFNIWTIGTNIYGYLKSIIESLDEMDEKTIIKEIEKDINSEKKFKLFFSTNNINKDFYVNSKKEYYSKTTSRQLLDVLSSLLLIEKNNDKKYIINKELINLKQDRKSKKSIEIVQEFIINKLEFYLEENIWKNLDKKINTKIKNNSRNFWFSIIITIGIEYKKEISLDWNFLEELKKTKFWLEIEKKEELDKSTIYYKSFIQKIFLDNKISSELKNKFFKIIKNFFINFKNLIDANKESYLHKPLNKSKPIKINKINENYNKDKLEDIWENKINFDLNDYVNKKGNSIEDKIDEEIRKKHGKNEEFILIKTSLETFFVSEYINYNLPIFQRTYSWDANFISSLFYSIYEDYSKNKSFTLLNTVILYQMDNRTSIIDGQQRIASIIIIIICLFKYSLYLNDAKTEKLLDNIIIKIANIVNSFKKDNKDYGFIFKISKSEKDKNNNLENDIKNSKFYKNWQEITKLIKKEIKDNNNLIKFCQYILNNTFFIFVYLKLKDNDHRNATKIFNNLNKISKRIGILDLLRSKLYDEFLSNKDNFYKDSWDYIAIYNHTINLYFRQKNKTDGKEDISIINDFLDSSLLVKSYDDYYVTKILEIENQYDDEWFKASFKIDLFFDYYKKIQQKDDILFLFWKNIVAFEYFKYGNFNHIKKIIYEFQKNEISNNILNFKKYYDNFSENTQKLKFINNQISHISNKGTTTVFISLICKIASKLNLINIIEKNEVSDKIFEKNKWNEISKFSFFLSEIEKFKVLWKINKFKGQSLTINILKIIKELKDEELQPFKCSLSSNLFRIIKEFTSLSNVKMIKDLYENLLSSKDENDIFTQILIKIDYSIELDRTYIELNNGYESLPSNTIWPQSPQFFWNYSSMGNSQKILSNNLNDNYSYDHHLPTNASEQEKEYEDNLKSDYPVLFNSFIKTKSEIGNGDLLHQKDNSTKNNRNRHPITAHYKEGKKSKIFKIIDFEKLDEQSNDIYFSNSYIEIPKVVSKPENTWSKKEWENYIINVKKRSETLIKSYISIIFYDWVKNK